MCASAIPCLNSRGFVHTMVCTPVCAVHAISCVGKKKHSSPIWLKKKPHTHTQKHPTNTYIDMSDCGSQMMIDVTYG